MPHWSDPLHATPTRFRIRVGHDEEFALCLGVTLVGRDASCAITIVDSLASRRHARIQCDGEQATIEDLGSRNGTRVNDLVISGPHALRAGDRVGIGAVELAVSVIEVGDGAFRDEPTGLLTVCIACRVCYSAEAAQCPKCGVRRASGEAPMPVPRVDDSAHARWSVSMLVEMVGKAMLVNNLSDAEKLMRRAAIVVGDQVRAGRLVDVEELRALEEASTWIDKATNGTAWTDWFDKVRTQLAVV